MSGWTWAPLLGERSIELRISVQPASLLRTESLSRNICGLFQGPSCVSPKYEFGGFRLEPARRRLSGRDGAPVMLSARAFDTLVYLVEHRDEQVSKRQLIEAIWPDAVVEENNLTQA